MLKIPALSFALWLRVLAAWGELFAVVWTDTHLPKIYLTVTLL
jgi:hypothetical protein